MTDLLERLHHLVELGVAVPAAAEHARTDRGVEAASLRRHVVADRRPNILEVDVAHRRRVVADDPDRVGASVCEVARIEAQADEGGIHAIEEPMDLLGRVRSLDSFAAFALTPLAMAVIGPAADAFGVRTVLAVCGIVASMLTVAAFLLPGMRDTESQISLS